MLVVSLSILEVDLVLLVLGHELLEEDFVLLLPMSDVLFDLRDLFSDIFSFNIFILSPLLDVCDLNLILLLLPSERLKMVSHQLLFELSDLFLMNLNTSVSTLDINFMLSIEFVQICDLSFKVSLSLDLKVLEVLFVLSIFLLIINPLLLISLALIHDSLDLILGLSVHLLILEFLVVGDDLGHHLDVWMGEVVVRFNELRGLLDGLPRLDLFIETLVENSNSWTS